eukprot:161180_1
MCFSASENLVGNLHCASLIVCNFRFFDIYDHSSIFSRLSIMGTYFSQILLPLSAIITQQNYYNIFKVEIENVLVCTSGDRVNMTQYLTQQNGAGGCLSQNIDIDGPYDIIINGNPVNYDANIISSQNLQSNIARFSFLTFDIGRTMMYVHVQLTLELINENARRRILSTSTSNQIRHFISSTSIMNDEKTIVFVTENIDNSTGNDNTDGASRIKILFLFILSISISVYIIL